MKIRTGFVSNSSSSSFIIGLANTGPNGEGEVFNPEDTSNFATGYNLRIYETVENGETVYTFSIKGGYGCDEITITANPGDCILHLDETGPDPDAYDDYDIPFEDFFESDREFANKIEAAGGVIDYGGTYDG